MKLETRVEQSYRNLKYQIHLFIFLSLDQQKEYIYIYIYIYILCVGPTREKYIYSE